MATAAQAAIILEAAKRPGLFGLAGKAIEKRCLNGLASYFKQVGSAVDALDLGKLANQPLAQARQTAEMAIENVLRRQHTDNLKAILKLSIFHAQLAGYKQAEFAEAYSDDEPRDEKGRWSASDSIKVSDKAFDTKFGYGTFDKLGRMEVPTKNIVITQEYITQKGIDKYKGKSKTEPPILVKRGSKFYVADGHHRIAAAVANGKKSITADILRYGG